MNDLFYDACRDGNLEEIKKIFENKIIDIHADNEWAFRLFCRKGNFECAKWLYEISVKELNIHANNEDAFCFACYFGHFELAKWLLEISLENKDIINIHYDNEFVFRWSCLKGFIDIAK